MVLKDRIPENTGIQFPCEDIIIGDVLRDSGILPESGAQMCQFNFSNNNYEPSCYYRCKSQIHEDFDREGDIKAMRYLFSKGE
jgi:hypothetical protein